MLYVPKEKVVKVSRYATKPYFVGAYQFEYPQVADVFAYCFRNYGSAVALETIQKLEDKLNTTLRKFVRDKVGDEVKDFLLGKAGLSAPGGLPMKIVEFFVAVAGIAWIRSSAERHKRINEKSCTEYTPTNNIDEYVDYVLCTWVIDPDFGPYYTTILPGSLAPGRR